VFLIAFFSIFLLFGLGFFSFFAIAAVRILAAQFWQETPCVVLSSRVDDGSVHIVYQYEVGGRSYQSNRYTFLSGSFGDDSRESRIVREHPPGRQTVCYVNPQEPEEAVLTRSFTPEFVWALFPSVFILVGGGGIFFNLLASRGARGGADFRCNAVNETTTLGPTEMRSAGTTLQGGPVILRSKLSPRARFFGCIFVCIFWNGIVSVFLTQVISGWLHPGPQGRPIFLSLFLTPFALIGLGLIGGVFYYFLALFNPRPQLTLSSRFVPLGGSATLEWSFSGATDRITRLRIFVQGEEVATYRRGTDTTTKRNVFAEIAVVEQTELSRLASGVDRFRIPETTMHTFTARNNKIVWSVNLKGAIRFWPDLKEQFEFEVRPAPIPSGETS
jgi:hypothetical protein